MTTGCESARSSSLKSRPATSGSRSVAKNPDSTSEPVRGEERPSIGRRHSRHGHTLVGHAAEVVRRWDAFGDGRRLHARQPTDALAHGAREERSCRGGVSRQREIDGCDLDAVRIVSLVANGHALQRAQEESGDDDEQNAEGDLADDKSAAQPQAIGRLRLVFERGYDVGSGRLKTGGQAREHRRQQRQSHR